MTLKPRIRSNIALNANPEGCEKNVLNQIEALQNLPKIHEGPLNVLIVGGSSGYGLATRIALTYKANAYTYNVSYESAPSANRTGTAGYYNNIAFTKFATQDGYHCDDYLGDAFSDEAKLAVIEHFKAMEKTIDLIVYSVASGVRIDPVDGVKYVSSLKPVDTPYTGLNVDIVKRTLSSMTLEKATDDEIMQTVKVMGGDDYLRWVQMLRDADVLSQGAQAVTYTYFGSKLTDPIYRHGTIGHAKRDLEAKNRKVHEILKEIGGRATISASKAVVTKASVFIPTMALYVSALFKVMKERNTHEQVIEHKYRLFKDMIFNKDYAIGDDLIVHPDAYELDPSVQAQVESLLENINQDNFVSVVDFEAFIQEFLEINGFDLSDLESF